VPENLTLTIDIAAQPATVFQFLSDPEKFKQWMGPGANVGDGCITVQYPAGETARGTLRESVPGKRIAFGWGYDQGTHGLAPDSTTVVIELEPISIGTRVTLTHYGLDAAQQAEHAKGWKHYLAQLAGAAAGAVFAEALPKSVEAYVAAWNETDLAKRAELLELCWEETGVFRDSMGVAEGRIQLLHYIAGAQQFVPGFRLEASGTPEHCHGHYRFQWLIRLPDGSVMARGTNYGHMAPTGRFQLAIGFGDRA